MLAYRRALGDAFLAWQGETSFDPPGGLRAGERLDDDWSAEGLSDPRPRTVCPDAVLEVASEEAASPPRLLLIEYDRTRRLDKNYEKFRRYDTFLNWWWQRTHLADRAAAPFVVFVCQDDEHRDDFIAAADRELTGHRWHPDVTPDRYEYIGRQRILFATEIDAHNGWLEARRLPTFPRGHRARADDVRRVRIGPSPATAARGANTGTRRAACPITVPTFWAIAAEVVLWKRAHIAQPAEAPGAHLFVLANAAIGKYLGDDAEELVVAKPAPVKRSPDRRPLSAANLYRG